jgi:hypothetical protein
MKKKVKKYFGLIIASGESLLSIVLVYWLLWVLEALLGIGEKREKE